MGRGRIVLLDATIYGTGQKSECELLARKDDPHGELGAGCPYSDCAVISSCVNLPDGEYTVVFDGYFATVKRQRGHWVSVGIPRAL